MPYDYGGDSKKAMDKMSGKGKKDKAYNMTYSGESNTMPMSNKSYAGYGLSPGKRTKRSAK